MYNVTSLLNQQAPKLSSEGTSIHMNDSELILSEIKLYSVGYKMSFL